MCEDNEWDEKKYIYIPGIYLVYKIEKNPLKKSNSERQSGKEEKTVVPPRRRCGGHYKKTQEMWRTRQKKLKKRHTKRLILKNRVRPRTKGNITQTTAQGMKQREAYSLYMLWCCFITSFFSSVCHVLFHFRFCFLCFCFLWFSF